MDDALSSLKAHLDAVQAELSTLGDTPDPSRALAVVAANNLTALDVGRRRLAVALTSNTVAKFAFRPGGLGDNELEWLVWRAADAALRRLLAPTLWRTAGGVNVQARCVPTSIDAVDGAAHLTRALARWGITDAAVNLGFFEGRPVCYDYALLRPELATELLAQRR